MGQTQNGINTRIEQLKEDLNFDYPDRVTVFKKEVIDYAFSRFEISSVAELGCIWGVDGAYGQYIHDKYHPQVTMVDAIWSDEARKKCAVRPDIKTIDGNFCDTDMPERIGKVDVVIFFDILLHMVAPNWDELLRMYSDHTDMFLIVNPQLTSTDITVRLLDLGHDEYFRNIPHPPDYPIYKRVFENPWEMDLSQNKPLRDTFYIWQWGITNHDLIDKMDKLGFELTMMQKGTLYYGEARDFHDYGFIFKKKKQCVHKLEV